MEISQPEEQRSLTTNKALKAKASQSSQSVNTTVEAPIDALLRKHVKTSSDTAARKERKVDGVLIGVLSGLNSKGNPLVSSEHLDLKDIEARSLIAITEADCGRAVALGFEAGNPDFPIVLGFMQIQESTPKISGNQVVVDTQEGRVVVTAEDELELRCGEAVILMQADGRITLRGEYITSHASAGQRIRGGSVQIN